MPKRFTDTDKWKKPFIRGLDAPYKLLWLYILDDCDMAGIWQIDFEVAKIRIGEDINEKRALEVFGDRIKIFGNKWFIKDFIFFQYGELKHTNRMHSAVISTLEKNNIIIFKDGASEPLPRGQGIIQGKGQGKSKGQGRDEIFESIMSDELFVEGLQITHKGSDIKQAFDECYNHHSVALKHPIEHWEWKQKLNTWLTIKQKPNGINGDKKETGPIKSFAGTNYRSKL